ncbi:MAG: Smr/MutS family protein [Proteobacteria bacterium]|nr:Smr/MutS family protein [Pseudomonadota bacterium]
MKDPKPSLSINRPFDGLGDRLRAGRPNQKASPGPEPIPLAQVLKSGGTAKPVKAPDAMPPLASESEEVLFLKAMENVTPLFPGSSRDPAGPRDAGDARPVGDESGDDLARRMLEELVSGGGGMVVSLTAEYVEGAGYGVHPSVPGQLHRGNFSIQAHLDLHGLTQADAAECFEEFMGDAVHTGKRAVSVIHGRGLSSPGDPVLKAAVLHWLSRGPWRKWVLAFASARACDGGTGATYVLLRTRPVTRRGKKMVKEW